MGPADAGAMLGGMLVGGLFGLAIFAFWVYELIDCLKSNFKGPNDKIIWALVIIFLGPLGAILYQFVGKGQKTLALSNKSSSTTGDIAASN